MTNDPPRHSSPDVGPDWDTLARYLAGESPPEETTVVRGWLDAHPVDRDLVERLDGFVMLEAPTDLDVDSAIARVHARMAEPAAPARLRIERGVRAPAPRPWRTMAGGALLAAAVVAGIVATLHWRAGSPASSPAAAAHVYATRIGQRDSITLADGSRVILGPDSRLTVPAGYASSTRAVTLEGDAYFDVYHDATRPFSARVGLAVIEDVGTTFSVESDAGNATTVSVMAGSVRLRAADAAATSGAVLAAGDRGSITADGHVAAYPNTVRPEDTAWTTGRLVFDNAPLTRVAAEMHRWYGVTLLIADSSLASRHISTSFSGEPVDQVLQVIGLALGARIDRQGDTATVHLRRGPATAR